MWVYGEMVGGGDKGGEGGLGTVMAYVLYRRKIFVAL
jgi:hypothetical protein